MTELLIFLATVAVLTVAGLVILEVHLDDPPGRRRRPPQSHPDDVFARGAHHRDPRW